MSLLTGLRRMSRALPISRRLLHRLRRTAGAGFQIAAFLRHGLTRRSAAARPGPVCVVGFHGSVLGIGEAARAFSASLRTAGAEVVDWDISAHFGHEVRLEGQYADEPPARASSIVIFLNPRELVQLVAMLGAGPFKNRFCVGAWAWELESVPPAWKAGFRYVDEVWACSQFVADAVAARSPRSLPIRVLPHPLPAPTAKPDRPAFDLPDDAVVVLTAFDVRSGFVRKNPIAAVRAFRAARRRTAVPTVMLCKITGTEGAPELCAMLEAEIGYAGDVRLVRSWLTADQMAVLVASVDIVLSLHRSEGFGLLPAQAMLAGKAVMATRWSGNLDYMTDDDSVLVDYRLIPVEDPQGLYDSGRWANPDVEQAGGQLAALMADAGERRLLGERAVANVTRALDPLRLGRRARTWLGHGDFGD